MGEAQSFGQWLRRRRRELDLTQEELGHRVGCAPITIRKLEADQMRPSKQLAELLMEQLGIAPEQREDFVRFARGGESTESVTAVTPKHNLPHPVSSFIGREREIVDIQGLLSTSRLVTLTGVGGCGKSRLALEVARGLVNTIEDGVWWVELAALTVDSLVPQTIARAFDLREAPNQETSETLANFLHNKQLLLVIDNCEHLINGCAQLADRLLRECSNLKILATSREPLVIGGETVYQVPPLSLPEPSETTLGRSLESEAACLFLERAEAVKPDFALTEQNATAVVQICHRLDGIPLALELAAARIRLLTVEHIAERLDDRFSLLTGGSRTALPRQQTLRATIDWSHDLLSEKTQMLFRRLSVFAGGFSLSGAEAICSDEHLVSSEIFPELSRLADRSLVEVVQKEKGERYRMLETIRLYARERLQESGEEARLRDRHLEYFTEWAEQVEPKLRGPEQMVWWDQIEMEHNNIRSALNWSLGGGDVQLGLRLSGAAYWFWDPRDHMREGLKWLKEMLAKTAPQHRTKARAKALMAAGVLAVFDLTTTDPAVDWFMESLEIFREQGDPWWIAYALTTLGWYHLYNAEPMVAEEKFKEAVAYARREEDGWILAYTLKGLGSALERFDYAAARPILEESLAIWREVGVLEGIADTLNQLGTVAHGQGLEEEAIMLLEESLALSRKIESKTYTAMVLDNLGECLQTHGDNERAERLFREAIILEQEISYYHGIAWSLCGLGGVAGEQRKPERAARLLGAAQAWRKSVGEDLSAWPYVLNDYARWEDTARAQLDEEAFATAYAEGQAMTLEQAVKYALEGDKAD